MSTRRQKGTGGLSQRSRDGAWVGTIDLGWGADGKRRVKTVSSKNYKTAQRRHAELRRQYETTGGVPLGTLTVKAWLDYWLEHIAGKSVRPRTLDAYRSHAANYIVPAIGRRRLDQLQPQHVREVGIYVTAQPSPRDPTKTLSSTTAKHAHALLSKALADAVKEGRITRNVAELVAAPRRDRTPQKYLTADQGIELLLSCDRAGDRLTSRWAMALLTGQRQGECLGLEAERVLPDRLDISWQLQRLRFDHGCKRPCGRKRGGNCPDRRLVFPPGFEYRKTTASGLFWTRPKTAAGWRVIPLVAPLDSILSAHLDGRTTGLVWAREDGQPIDPKDDNHAWHAALDRAGLPQVRLHDARHTTATLLLEAGVDPKTIGQILGQSSVVTTQAYQHVSLALASDAMEKLGRALTR